MEGSGKFDLKLKIQIPGHDVISANLTDIKLKL